MASINSLTGPEWRGYDRTMYAGLDRAYQDPRFAQGALSRASPEQLSTLAGNPGVMGHPVLGELIRGRMGGRGGGNPYAQQGGGALAQAEQQAQPGLIQRTRTALEGSDSRDFVTRAFDAVKERLARQGAGPESLPPGGVRVPIQRWDEAGYPASAGAGPRSQVRAPGALAGERGLRAPGVMAGEPIPPDMTGGEPAAALSAAAGPPGAAVAGGALGPAGQQPLGGAGGGGALSYKRAAAPGAAPLAAPTGKPERDWREIMLNAGLAMMAGGGQPGANTLGVLGQGLAHGLAADKAGQAARGGAAQQKFENEVRLRELAAAEERARAAEERTAGAGRQTVVLENGNLGVLDRSTGKIVDTGEKGYTGTGRGALSGGRPPANMMIAQWLMQADPNLSEAEALRKAQGAEGRREVALLNARARVMEQVADDPMMQGAPAEEMQAEVDRRMQALMPGAAGGTTAPLEVPIPGGPAVGDVVEGYRFKGGDPSDEANWEPVE